MERELPTISSYAANTSLYYAPTAGNAANHFAAKAIGCDLGELSRRFQQMQHQNIFEQLNKKEDQQKESKMAEKPTRRIIRVFIVDPSEALSLDKAILHQGAEQLTDLTDEELFMEIGIKPLLDKHNELRAATLDKKASHKAGKDVYLEPLRIRDLKMVVSTVAAF